MRRMMSVAFSLAVLTLSPAVAQTVSLTSDKPEYKLGDSPVFTVKTKEDCFLTLISISAEGTGVVLYPNRFQRDNRIKAGIDFLIPGPNAPFTYTLSKCGDERTFAICTPTPLAIRGVTHDFGRAIVTGVQTNDFQQWVSVNKDHVAEITFKVSPPPRPEGSQ